MESESNLFTFTSVQELYQLVKPVRAGIKSQHSYWLSTAKKKKNVAHIWMFSTGKKRVREKSHWSAGHRGYRQKQYRWVIAPSSLTDIKSSSVIGQVCENYENLEAIGHTAVEEREPGLSARPRRGLEVGHERATKINQQSRGHYHTNNPIKSKPQGLARTHLGRRTRVFITVSEVRWRPTWTERISAYS